MMKILLYTILILLTISVNAQEQKSFEPWWDYGDANEKEIAKTERFLKKNNININKIINPTYGIAKYTVDSLPYIEYLSGDTLIFLMPGGILPIERSKFELDNYGKIVGNNNCFIDGIRKDGRISLRTPHKFSFLIQNKMLYALVSYPNKSNEELGKIILKLGKAKSEIEKNNLLNELKSSYTIQPELVANLSNKNNINDTIKIKNEKYSRIINIYKKYDNKYFEIKLNFDPYRGRKDLTFTVDENLRMVKLAEFEFINE